MRQDYLSFILIGLLALCISLISTNKIIKEQKVIAEKKLMLMKAEQKKRNKKVEKRRKRRSLSGYAKHTR